MKRKIIVLTLSAILLALCFPAEAQQPKKVFRIGYLSATDRATDAPRSEGVRRALRNLGYIEGQNLVIEYRHAEGKPGRNAELAAELVRLNVDLIVVAGGDGGIQAAMNATKTIPILMMGQGSDPVKAGFVASLARPGGNVTGLTNLTMELGGKRLELLKEAVPKIARVAVLLDPNAPGTEREMKDDILPGAQASKLTIQPREVRVVADFDKVLPALSKERPDGLYVIGAGSKVRPNLNRITDFALKNRLPSVFSSRDPVNAADSCTTALMKTNATGALPITSIKFSRAPSLPICRLNNPLGLSLSSIIRPRSRSASRFRPTC